MGVDISALGPAAQTQVRAELARRELNQRAQEKQHRERAAPATDGMGSNLEREYYAAYIWPKVLAGLVASVEVQRRFDLWPAADYCGLHLPPAHYKPDFFITYATGTVEVVEVKSHFTRKAQRDYIYRRRLFIELYARPKGWKFTEYIPPEK